MTLQMYYSASSWSTKPWIANTYILSILIDVEANLVLKKGPHFSPSGSSTAPW